MFIDFTARRYASAACCCRVCLSVCHKSQFYQTAKHRITQTRPHNSVEILVFCC